MDFLSPADHPSPRPVSKPTHHRVSPTDHLPSATGSSSVFPPTLPSPPVPENRRPTSFGTSFPPAAIQGNFNSPSQSPFGGFGYGGGWSSGVWAPNSSSASGSGGTSPGAHGLHVKLFVLLSFFCPDVKCVICTCEINRSVDSKSLIGTHNGCC